MKSFGPGKHVFVRLAAWASPRASTLNETRGAMPTRLNDLEMLHRAPEARPLTRPRLTLVGRLSRSGWDLGGIESHEVISGQFLNQPGYAACRI
ncbi:hypothetical protein LF1_44120 [Rubripirellula obstinata]|uniref:Uncharacterized protein n=1 Tax=Rubripirellula obstinata TaxID=406547 RepID=A0A5B1CNI2_9BACT|nr:hypothetical protein LF1_44120 [Rubripirellula obstinata]